MRTNDLSAKPTTYVTTSWDDGHPLDFRIAELLKKYGLRGTFYIPKSAANETMTEAQLRGLGDEFEIGAHTLGHVVLTEVSNARALTEIEGSKAWIENATGKHCLVFCPPEGKYSDRHLEMVFSAGFLGLRSVELGSLDMPRLRKAGLLLPTSIQAYPHPARVFILNALKRACVGNLWRFAAIGRSDVWPELARSYFLEALKRGGVFHLWGHSWELEATDQWRHLEEVLRFLGEYAREARFLDNGGLCSAEAAHSTPVRVHGSLREIAS
jgi:peptidoglycan-N-acetylglucosamine deacetylase